MEKRVYPWVILGISLAVVLHYAVSYYNFTRGDAAIEYGVYAAIVKGHPMPFGSPNLLVSCLTTTYFPALLQRWTGINEALLFRYYAVPLLALLPLVVYWLALRFVAPSEAFCVACLFIAQPYFVVAPMVSRIIIGETIFLLSILIIMQNKLRLVWKVVLLCATSVLLVITAYSVAFLAIAFYLGWLIVGLFYSWFNRKVLKSIIPLAILLPVVLVVAAIWMRFITWLPWQYATEMVINTLAGVTGQDGMASVALGQTFGTMNICQRYEVVLTWVLMGLISLGLLYKADSFTLEHAAAVTGYGLLVAGIIYPTIDSYFGIQRVYFCVSPLLLIFAVYGMRWMTKFIPKPLMPAITIAYSLAGTGILYYVLGFDRFVH